MRALKKSAFRLFKKHILRLITIAAIVMVSVGFMSGVGEVESRIKTAADRYYAKQNISDFYIKSSRISGFNSDELEYLTEYFGSENILQSFCAEFDNDGSVVREYMYNVQNANVNKIQLLSGRFPVADNEILIERATHNIKSCNDGGSITLPDPVTGEMREYTVTGTVLNPLIINEIEEPSFAFENRSLDYVVYFNRDPLIVNDLYAAKAVRTEFKAFCKPYKKSVNTVKAELENRLNSNGESNVSVLTLYQNFGMYSLISYAEKVGLISIIFVVFFLLVTMLVVYSNMSRLFDEERGQIACMKTLGYSDFSIVNRYTLFVFIATLIGGALSAPLGLGVTAVIYKAFNMQYAMPPFPGISKFGYFGLTFGIIILVTLLLTYFTGMKIIGNKPVVLLARKAPKSGKKVILEHIPFIWNRLSFKHKSTMRNVLLFKSRFFMTVISIIGSTVLVLAGLGLADCAAKMENAGSILAISIALIVFSAMLCALVIYNITNINVSERNREIATLMVLGYREKEVTGYIFREIYVMSFIGAVLGVPLGVGFMQFVFGLIDFGTLGDINWWTWILAPAVTMLFSFISTLLLRRKITKTDMNASLKTLE